MKHREEKRTLFFAFSEIFRSAIRCSLSKHRPITAAKAGIAGREYHSNLVFATEMMTK